MPRTASLNQQWRLRVAAKLSAIRLPLLVSLQQGHKLSWVSQNLWSFNAFYKMQAMKMNPFCPKLHGFRFPCCHKGTDHSTISQLPNYSIIMFTPPLLWSTHHMFHHHSWKQVEEIYSRSATRLVLSIMLSIMKRYQYVINNETFW